MRNKDSKENLESMEGHEKDQNCNRSNVPQPQAQAWENTNTVFTNEKAGMKGVDKDKIKKVIYEMSKVSHPYIDIFLGQILQS